MPERKAGSKAKTSAASSKPAAAGRAAAKTPAKVVTKAVASKAAATKTAPKKRATAVAAKVVPAKRTVRRGAASSEKAEAANPLRAPLFDSAGGRSGEFELPGVIFAVTPNMPVMHQAFVRQQANARQGTASTKTRADVSGGGAKPYRQKGTGRARHGSTREPSMKGGAVVFGPHPRSYAQRMPRQMRRLALRSALSQKAMDGQIGVIETFTFEEPKTKQAADLMGAIGFDSSALVVLPAPNYVVSRSFENLPSAKIILARNLNIHDLFSHEFLLLAKESVELIEDSFSPRQKDSGR
ncbi:MAG: 50S ribosomal protein L4 [Candidatus Dormibacterales bacterium]